MELIIVLAIVYFVVMLIIDFTKPEYKPPILPKGKNRIG